MALARTVLGDIPVEKLGITLPHEHITFSWGSARRDLGTLYDRNAILKQICDEVRAAKRDHGINTILCASAPEMGRDVDLCAEVSRQTGVNIIASTGFHRQGSGTSIYVHFATQDRIEEWMTLEITEGVGRNNVKCGNIKLGENGFAPTPVEEKCIRAGARVSRKLGTPISLNVVFADSRSGTPDTEGLRPGTDTSTRTIPPGVNPGLDLIDILTSEGADPSRVKIDHAQRTEVGHLLEIVRRGAYICLDAVDKTFNWDQRIVGTIGALITAGYAKQVLLSLDHVAAWIPTQRAWNKEKWVQDYGYMHRETVPSLLEGGVTEKDIEHILVTAPRNFLGF